MLTRPRYLIALNHDGTVSEHEIEVTPGDQFRAELEAGKHGIPALSVAPMQGTGVWVWAAAVRLGLTTADWRTFRDDTLHAFEAVRDINGDPAQVPVDPTTEEPSDSGSSSPTTTPASSSTGSTPTSTNA